MKGKFKLGLILGGIAGFLGGLFLSSDPGTHMRAKTAKEYELLKKHFENKTFEQALEEIFGEVNDEAKELVRTTQQQVVTRIIHLQETARSLDRQKYSAIVQEVVDELRSTSTVQPVTAKKIQAYLLSDFKKLTSTVTPPKKATATPPKKKPKTKKI